MRSKSSSCPNSLLMRLRRRQGHLWETIVATLCQFPANIVVKCSSRRNDPPWHVCLCGNVDQRNRHISSRSPFYSRSDEHTSELQSLMRISYAVFCLQKKTK